MFKVDDSLSTPNWPMSSVYMQQITTLQSVTIYDYDCQEQKQKMLGSEGCCCGGSYYYYCFYILLPVQASNPFAYNLSNPAGKNSSKVDKTV